MRKRRTGNFLEMGKNEDVKCIKAQLVSLKSSMFKVNIL
jgi:hypothetical protein